MQTCPYTRGEGSTPGQYPFLFLFKRKGYSMYWKKYIFLWTFLRNIFIWAGLLHKDPCKLKSSTQENTFLNIVERIQFKKIVWKCFRPFWILWYTYRKMIFALRWGGGVKNFRTSRSNSWKQIFMEYLYVWQSRPKHIK